MTAPRDASGRGPVRPPGFGLVELLVAMVIMGAVLSMVFGGLQRSQRQAASVTRVADQRQMGRTAIQLIERECRMAGSGWGRDTVQAGHAGASSALWAVNPGYGGEARSDSIQFVGAWQAATTLTASMPNVTSPMSVASIDGFATGDFIIVTDATAAHLLQVTGRQASPPALLHDNTSPYNSGHALWPLGGGYPSGTTNVYKATLATYRFDSTTYRRPCLVRTEWGQAPQVVAYDVDGFRVWYELEDGTWTRDPVTLTFVDKIMPVVYTRITDPSLSTPRDSLWAVIRPRTF